MSKYHIIIYNHENSVWSDKNTPEEAFAFMEANAEVGADVIIYAPDGSPYRVGVFHGKKKE